MTRRFFNISSVWQTRMLQQHDNKMRFPAAKKVKLDRSRSDFQHELFVINFRQMMGHMEGYKIQIDYAQY